MARLNFKTILLILIVLICSGFKFSDVWKNFYENVTNQEFKNKAANHPWQEYVFPEYNFRIQLPQSELKKSQNFSFAARSDRVQRSQIYETSTVWGCVYRIEAVEYVPGMSNAEQLSCMQETATQSAAKIKGQSVGKTSVNYIKNVDWYRYWFDPKDLEKGNGPIIRGRILRRGPQMIYNLSYVCEHYGAHIKKLRERFFDSFHTIE